MPLASGMRSLNHCTPREVPRLSFFIPGGLRDGKATEKFLLTTTQGQEATDAGEGFGVIPIFLQSCQIFLGREGEHI